VTPRAHNPSAVLLQMYKCTLKTETRKSPATTNGLEGGRPRRPHAAHARSGTIVQGSRPAKLAAATRSLGRTSQVTGTLSTLRERFDSHCYECRFGKFVKHKNSFKRCRLQSHHTDVDWILDPRCGSEAKQTGSSQTKHGRPPPDNGSAHDQGPCGGSGVSRGDGPAKESVVSKLTAVKAEHAALTLQIVLLRRQLGEPAVSGTDPASSRPADDQGEGILYV
jgi:hypothetical protein